MVEPDAGALATWSGWSRKLPRTPTPPPPPPTPLQELRTRSHGPPGAAAHNRTAASDAQTVAVSGGQGNASANACEGVLKPRVCRGRPFSSAAIASRSAWSSWPRSLLLGRYWLSSPLVFSLLPRCQGLRGSQKYTWTPVSTVNLVCSAISLP